MSGLLCLSSAGFGQAKETKLSNNATFAAASVGIVSYGTLNYERKIYSGAKVNWYGRLGAGAAINPNSQTGFGGLAAITLITGKKNNHFETSLGVFRSVGATSSFVYPVLDIGYRYQKPEGGLLFRTHVGLLSVGVGLGFAF